MGAAIKHTGVSINDDAVQSGHGWSGALADFNDLVEWLAEERLFAGLLELVTWGDETL
jgi:hypothetical protein